MPSKPTTIPHTQRQRITSRSGVDLERAYVFMSGPSWEALTRLCEASHQSGSQVIEQLITQAVSGNYKDQSNVKTSPRNI